MSSNFNFLLDSNYSNISFSQLKNASDVQYLISLSLNHGYYTVYLQSAYKPNVEESVITGLNDRLVFRENGGVIDFTATLPSGFYNATSYASSLTLAMNKSYTVCYNNSTLKSTITANLPNTFSIRNSSTMLNEIGWSNSQLNTFTTTKTCDYVCDISGSHDVDIQANLNTRTIDSGMNRNNILARIQLDVPKGNCILQKSS